MRKMKFKIIDIAIGFLAGFLRNEQIFKKFVNKIDLFDFDSIQQGLNFIIEKAKAHYCQYKMLAPRGFYDFEIDKSLFDEDTKKILFKIIDEIFNFDLQRNVFFVDAFRDEMVKMFLKSYFNGINEKIEQAQDIQGLVTDLMRTIREAEKFYHTEEIWDYAATFAEREAERNMRKNNPAYIKILRTGIKELDAQIMMVPRTITAFLAPYKRYKSITLTHIGWAALLQGFNVLHIHYEGRKEMWEARYDARFTNLDYTKIVNMIRTEEEEERVQRIMSRVNSWKQRLFLAKGIAHQTNVDDIMIQIENIYLEHGIKIDVVIIDYFQIMGPSSVRMFKGEDDWLIQGNIAWDLVRLANCDDTGKIVVGALQSRISGISAKTLRSEHSGRSIIYQQAIDNLIAINQTEDEYREGIIRYSPLFIRDGEIKKEHCKVESEMWKIKIAKEADALWEEVKDEI